MQELCTGGGVFRKLALCLNGLRSWPFKQKNRIRPDVTWSTSARAESGFRRVYEVVYGYFRKKAFLVEGGASDVLWWNAKHTISCSVSIQGGQILITETGISGMFRYPSHWRPEELDVTFDIYNKKKSWCKTLALSLRLNGRSVLIEYI